MTSPHSVVPVSQAPFLENMPLAFCSGEKTSTRPLKQRGGVGLVFTANSRLILLFFVLVHQQFQKHTEFPFPKTFWDGSVVKIGLILAFPLLAKELIILELLI